MKKNYFILAAAAILAFASCEKPVEIEQNEPVVVKLTVNSEIATKTGVVDNGTTVKHVWSKNDKIKAFIGALDETRTDVLTLTNTSGEGVEKAVFEGKTNVKLERQAYQVYAVGPSASKVNEAKLNGEVATVALSSEQTPSAVGTFDRGADILVATPVELTVADSLCTAEISFSRPAALLKLAISDPDGKISSDVISSVKISTVSTPIAGYLSVNLANLEAEVASSPSNDITVTYDEALNFVADGKNAAWIVAAPAEIPAGELTVTIVTDKNVITKTIAEAVTLSPVKVNELTFTVDSSCQFVKKFIFSGGKGSADEPFKLASAQDIVDLASYTNGVDVPEAYASFNFSEANYKVDADIVFAETDTLFVSPFASTDKPLTATFDGANHKITGLKIKNVTEAEAVGKPAGLVACAGLGAVVKDLTLENVQVYSDAINTGAFVGEALGATLTNLNITGGAEKSLVYNTAKYLPGATDMYGAWYAAENNVNASVCGGIVGYAKNAVISDCTVSAKVYNLQRYLGGIVGFVDTGDLTTITNCTINKDAYVGTNNTNVGGIVGSNRDANLQIKGCKVYSEVYSKYSYNGGIIGASYGATIEDCEVVGSKVWISVSASTATGASGNLGAIVGYHYSGNMSLKNCKVNDCYIYGGHSTAGFIGISGRTGQTSETLEIVNCSASRDSVIAVRPYQTSSTDKNYNYVGGVIGYMTAYVNNVTIDNVNLDEVYVSSVAKGSAGFIGFNATNTTIKNSSISNSKIHNLCTQNAVISGGFVGYANKGNLTMDRCVAKNTSIISEANNDNVSMGAYLGLIVGQIAGTSCTITNCVAGSKCYIKGSYSLGGIVGGCQAPAPPFKMIIDKCSSYVTIESSNTQVGGIVGLLGNSEARVGTVAVVSNCYYGTGTLSSGHTGPHIGGIAGRVGNYKDSQTDHMANYLVNNFARPAKLVASGQTSAKALIGGVYGSAGYGAHIFNAWTDINPAQIESVNGEESGIYPIFGSMYTMAKWDNSAAYVFYSNNFKLAGYCAGGESDYALIENNEAVESFTDGTLLGKLNAGVAAYNATPLVEGPAAETWVAGTDGYPTLSSVIPDPDAK